MFISSGRPIQEGDEIFLQYGAHPNLKLFIEYGFVNTFSDGDCLRGDFVGQVALQDIVEEMFEKRKGGVGEWMSQVLEDEGYWGYSCSFLCIYVHINTNIFYLSLVMIGLARLQRLDNAFLADACSPVL